ncbi:MAG: hypothetical protein ACRYFW_09825 [Janthinobacterium lividum]
MSHRLDYRYHFERAEREAIRAIQSSHAVVAAIHEELSLRHAGRALAALMEAGADRMRAARA